TDCQTATGTTFRVSVRVQGATLKITGKPNIYVKTTADSGIPRVQAFCGSCGSPPFSTTFGDGVPPMYILRVRILRQRDQFVPKRQIWWRSAQPCGSRKSLICPNTKNKAHRGVSHDRDRIPLAAEARRARRICRARQSHERTGADDVGLHFAQGL